MPFSSSVPSSPPSTPVASAVPPFSAGSVIGRSFSVWIRNLVPFSLVTLVVYVPVLALAVAVPEGAGSELASRILSALADLVIGGALTFGVLESLRGGRAGIGALFGKGFGKTGTVFAVSFRVGLWLFLGAILLVVPAVLWYCALFVAVPAAVVEDGLRSPGDALARSRELTRGNRWGILAVGLVILVVTIVAVGVAAALVAALGAPPGIESFLVSAVAALLSAFGASAHAVAYHDLRVAKEGVSTADLVKVFE